MDHVISESKYITLQWWNLIWSKVEILSFSRKSWLANQEDMAVSKAYICFLKPNELSYIFFNELFEPTKIFLTHIIITHIIRVISTLCDLNSCWCLWLIFYLLHLLGVWRTSSEELESNSYQRAGSLRYIYMKNIAFKLNFLSYTY